MSNKNIHFKKSFCAPKDKTSTSSASSSSNTCFSDDSLFILRDRWNKRNPSNKIDTETPSQIWKLLKLKLINVCDNEKCWLRQNMFQITNNDNNMNSSYKQQFNKLKYFTFVPDRPEKWNKHPNDWLDSKNIQGVMNQYEKAYERFRFIGPSPIDYDKKNTYTGEKCVWFDLCQFKLIKYLKKECYQIGIIFNTDNHRGGGEHWIALFIDIKKNTIYFFDSLGEQPPRQVKTFISTVVKQASQLDITLRVVKNNIVHQKMDSECGMYCLHFIIESIHGRTDHIFKERISDKQIETYRNIYFQ